VSPEGVRIASNQPEEMPGGCHEAGLVRHWSKRNIAVLSALYPAFSFADEGKQTREIGLLMSQGALVEHSGVRKLGRLHQLEDSRQAPFLTSGAFLPLQSPKKGKN